MIYKEGTCYKKKGYTISGMYTNHDKSPISLSGTVKLYKFSSLVKTVAGYNSLVECTKSCGQLSAEWNHAQI